MSRLESNPWQTLIDEGHDVSLLEENLALTPRQRLEHLNGAAQGLSRLRAAIARITPTETTASDAKLHRPPTTPLRT